MRSRNLVRWCARAALLGGALAVLVGLLTLLNPEYYRYESPLDYLVAVVEGAALLGILGGVVGLHLWHSPHYGRLGKSGFYAAFFGTVVAGVGHLGALPFLEFVNTGSVVYVLIGLGQGIVLIGGVAYVLGALLMSVGSVLLGVAVTRARVLPLWCGPALIAGLAGLWTLGNFGGWLAFGLAWASTGYALWSAGEMKRGSHDRVA